MKAAIKTTIFLAIALFTTQISNAQVSSSDAQKLNYCTKNTCYIVNPAAVEDHQQENAAQQKARKSAELMLRNLINEIHMNIEYGQYLHHSNFTRNADGSVTATVDFEKIFSSYDVDYNEVKFIATAKTKADAPAQDVLLTAEELENGVTIYPNANGEFNFEVMFLLSDVTSERINITADMKDYFAFNIPVKVQEAALAAK